ncbi:MAG: hypothetical protein BIFFINMI_03334 [Phycisphaerae bacterium]|nr:hypothetical protein [Phycisphaerae bacterium]
MRSFAVVCLSMTMLLAVWTGQPQPAVADEGVAVPQDAAAVLNNNSYWRWRVSWRRPIVPLEAMKAVRPDSSAPGLLPVHDVPFTNRPDIEKLEIAPPPDGWIKPEFNDVDWPRNPLAYFAGGYYQVGLIALRGTFAVADPSAAKGLYLSLDYRGGVVVYLNGKEVARKDMPDGPLTSATPARTYVDAAWVDAAGKMLATHADGKLTGDARHDRSAAFRLPTDALVKGANVLAVAVHRSDYHPVALQWFSQQNIHSSWWPVQLSNVTLAVAGGGVTPNVARPKGFFLRNVDIHDRLSADYYGDPNDALRPITIQAARNGAFNAAVAASSDAPIAGLVASVTDLKGPAGVIPASAVDVSYALLTDGATRIESSRRYYCYDGLTAKAPAEVPVDKGGGGAVQPVWIRVNVPRDAAAGLYKGELRIIATGLAQPTVVPVELNVADFVLPDPQQFRTGMTVYVSPTSESMAYKVPMWSEEHWKLVEQSLRLLGRVGNDLANIPVVDRTQFGNDDGWVYWIRTPDGTWDYDFTVFDRYMDLYQKWVGDPTFVVLQIWHAGGWSSRKVDDPNTVTVLDPKTGEKTHMQVPVFATAESKKFWSDFVAAARARLKKRGLEKALSIGILSDSTAPAEVLKMFAEIAPDMGWMRGCHSASRAKAPYGLGSGTGANVVLHEHCYGMTIQDPAKLIEKIWDQAVCPAAAYFRCDFDPLSPMGFHLTPERALYQGKRGVGRIGLDFWAFPDASKRSYDDVYNRWPQSSCAQRRPTVMKLAWHAPEGPITTQRFEMLCQGLQEAEAMIVIADAVDNRPDKLGADLAARCRQLWIDRINICRINNGYDRAAARDYAHWQEDTARVFATAAEVSAKLK